MALKIVYKICCGIDVHKTFVVACIASTNSKGVTTYESHRFSTYTKGLKDLLQWLLSLLLKPRNKFCFLQHQQIQTFPSCFINIPEKHPQTIVSMYEVSLL